MSKTITVNIKPGGAVTLKTDGFQGTECKDATKLLEKALGMVTSDKPTQEQYATTTVSGGLQANVG